MTVEVLSHLPATRKPRGRVELVSHVAPDVAEAFRQIYRTAFEPLMTRAPARQWLTDDEFRHEMTDESVLKFVARASDSDEIIALALMHTDLSTVPWISEPYFATRYPEHFGRGAIYYFGAMLVRPERQGGPWAMYLLDHIFHFLAERDGIGAFDCCTFNVETVGLPELVARIGHRVVQLDLQTLDHQTYYAAVVAGHK